MSYFTQKVMEPVEKRVCVCDKCGHILSSTGYDIPEEHNRVGNINKTLIRHEELERRSISFSDDIGYAHEDREHSEEFLHLCSECYNEFKEWLKK